MDQGFGLLNNDEVLYVNRGRILISNPTFKVREFLDALAQLISEQEEEWSEEIEGWFTDGLECEVLRLGNQGWQRGKVRIRLEFCPSDKPKLLKEDMRLREEGRREEGHRRSPREDVYARPNEFYEEDYQDEFGSGY